MSPRLLALLGAAGLLLGCGKYGPPVRAAAAERPAERPGIEVPLPAVTEPPAPAAPAAPEPEREPPPEGSP
jgi:hypothetical protein